MNKVFIPLSIIISGLIIGGAIFLSGRSGNVNPEVVTNGEVELEIRPVTDQDHIKGNPDAEILIVEYSDFECPFCSGFHGTMNRIIEEYGDSGEVAWVYRHMPLDQIHKYARPASEASECVASLGGSNAFWSYSDILFAGHDEKVPASEFLSNERLKEAALSLGIDEEAYTSCVESRQFEDRVDIDYQDGVKLSKADPNFGTPYNILISKSGVQTPIRGNQPYANVKNIIDSILSGEESQ